MLPAGGSKLITSYDGTTVRVTENEIANPVPEHQAKDSGHDERFSRFLHNCLGDFDSDMEDCLTTASDAAFASGKDAKPPVQLQVLFEVELCISRGLVHDLVVCE